MILCYQGSGQEALSLHQVKDHDVRASIISKPFPGEFFPEQIVSLTLDIPYQVHPILFNRLGMECSGTFHLGSDSCSADSPLNHLFYFVFFSFT